MHSSDSTIDSQKKDAVLVDMLVTAQFISISRRSYASLLQQR